MFFNIWNIINTSFILFIFTLIIFLILLYYYQHDLYLYEK